ncbi:MAG: chorismate synthase [Cytophagales bacterium]|nr:MAG: chorismate synthase [Cytophagales bacterium]
MGNSWGTIFRIATFGESHGKAIGVVIDGCPPNLPFDLDFIQNEMNRRKPGQSAIVTQRKENDQIEVLSGVWQGKTTGTPIALMLWNEDAKSQDYSHISHSFRPSHADYTYFAKYQQHYDYRGGGRSSARETAARVAAGAVAKLILQKLGTSVIAYTSQIGDIAIKEAFPKNMRTETIESNIVRCPEADKAEAMVQLIKEVRKEGDSIGGVVNCIIQNTPVGLGEPIFDKLHAELGKAMLSINAVKGFEYGSGFGGVSMRGSAHNDLFYREGEKVKTHTNYSGGIQGGISNGEDIYFRVAFKPVATLMQSQTSIDQEGNPTEIKGKGRHDPCVVPRAVPIVEAMAALVLVDFYLLQLRNSTDLFTAS